LCFYLNFQDYDKHESKHLQKHSLDKHLIDHSMDGNEKYLQTLGKMATETTSGLTNGTSEYISKTLTIKKILFARHDKGNCVFFVFLNFLVQDILNLQKLQNLAQFQNTHISQFPPGLQGLLGSTSIPPFSSPLNLSLGNPTLANQQQQHENNNTMGVAPPMPQLILASGQLVQGIQGAQLLIPTSQGTYLLYE
jgi:hypothetical protein